MASFTVPKVDVIVKPAPPPAFADVAKAANDLINKDFYDAAAAALEVKLKTPTGPAVTTKATRPHDGAISCSVEAKKSVSNGVTITETWNTANVLTSKVELDGTIAQGLKAELLNAFQPDKGNKGQKVSLYFKQPNFHLRGFADISASGSVSALVDAVASHEGYLVGGEAGYDVQKAAITRYAAAVGYQTPAYSLALTTANQMSVVTASYYQKVNSAVEAGIRASYDLKSNQAVGFEIASKYKIDPMSFAKARINNRGIASIAVNTKVNTGLTVGIGASIDTNKINESGHKIGTSFTFES
jgi:voltage-dependent anion channel protein 2